MNKKYRTIGQVYIDKFKSMVDGMFASPNVAYMTLKIEPYTEFTGWVKIWFLVTIECYNSDENIVYQQSVLLPLLPHVIKYVRTISKKIYETEIDEDNFTHMEDWKDESGLNTVYAYTLEETNDTSTHLILQDDNSQYTSKLENIIFINELFLAYNPSELICWDWSVVQNLIDQLNIHLYVEKIQ